MDLFVGFQGVKLFLNQTIESKKERRVRFNTQNTRRVEARERALETGTLTGESNLQRTIEVSEETRIQNPLAVTGPIRYEQAQIANESNESTIVVQQIRELEIS